MHKLILIIFLFLVSGVFSQSIENVDFRAEGKTIVVTYDFFHSKADPAINVELVFKDQQGGVITPKTLTGAIKNVKLGESKRIVWDVLADVSSLSGKYKAEVNIIRFNSVKIGNQIWMTENLNLDRFRNGDIIPEAKTAEEWKAAGNTKRPAWCYYHNDPKNGDKYGKLYNWFAVNDSRGLAPEGFKIATLSDWSELIDFLGGTSVAGGKLKSSTGWVSDGRAMGLLKVSDSTNESQFTALPSGLVRQDGNFDAEGTTGTWWTSTPDETNAVKAARLYIEFCYKIVHQSFSNKGMGLAVRCVKV